MATLNLNQALPGLSFSQPQQAAQAFNKASGTNNYSANNNSSGNVQYQVGGWYGNLGQYQGNGQFSQTPMGSNSGVQPSAPSIQKPNVDFGAIYDPLINQTRQQEDELTNTVLPNLYSQVDSQSAQFKNQLDAQKGEYDTQSQNNRNTLDRNQASALSQAQQTFNQLVQRNLNMYGSRGIGQGLNGLLSQGYQQTIGNTQGAYQESLGNLLATNNKFMLYYDTQLNNNSLQAEQSKKDAFQTYLTQLNAVRANRSQIESAKASQIANLETSFKNQINQIEVAKAQKAIDLSAWKEQFQYSMQAQSQQIAQQQSQFMGTNPFESTNTMSEYTPSTISQGQSPRSQYLAQNPDDRRDALSLLLG